MKVSAPKVILIQEDGERPVRYTDASKAAAHWARVKEEEWLAKNVKDPKFQVTNRYMRGRTTTSNEVYDEGRIRYRKLHRRALRVFRNILGTK